MAEPIAFYFDFSSPYGYLAAEQIDARAARHGRTVRWRPILLGAVFKVTGQSPLLDQPLRGTYARRDMARSARLHGLPLTLPDRFPFSGLAPSRAFYWLDEADERRAREYAKAVFRTAWQRGRAVDSPAAALALAAELGIDRDALEAGLAAPATKDRLRRETDGAIAKGIFGSPFILVDGEPFWGSDRLDMVERWLETGGW